MAAKQYASHYLTAPLSLTSVVGGRDDTPGYLLYVRRTRTDAFEGTFGKLVRGIVERRIRAEGPPALDTLRRKLEAGGPPGADAT